MGGDRSTDEYVHVLACAECPRISSATARGWMAYLVDDPDEEWPALEFCCPECARDGARFR